MIAALVAAGISFVSTMLGGMAALHWPARVQSLMALASGVVLSAAFFDLLPDAVNRAIALSMPVSLPIGVVLAGFLALHLVEKVVHHHHDDEEPDVAGLVGAAGFVIHSFFDGLAIGLGFRASAGLGLLVALAVIGHDFSDGLNTVSYLISHRHSASRSRWWLVADASTPMLGALTASLVPLPAQVFPIALGFFSGVFVYVASTSLLPQTRDLPPSRSLPLCMAGVAVMFLITRLS